MPQLIIERTDGGVSLGPIRDDADPAEQVAKWERSSGFTAAGFEVSNKAAPRPATRVFRNAWKTNGRGIDVDMPKARGIHMDRIRAARAPVLAALDIEYMRADEASDQAEKTRIAAERRRLRDLPATFDLSEAETPEALAALWPEGVARPDNS